MLVICPCGSNKNYDSCCQPLHSGEQEAASAEALMRSRYSAFVVKDFDYLEDSLDPQTRVTFDHASTREWAEAAQFEKLEVLSSEEQGNKGLVEFRAHYKMDGQNHIHHERSRFRKQAGQWFYREGKVLKPST